MPKTGTAVTKPRRCPLRLGGQSRLQPLQQGGPARLPLFIRRDFWQSSPAALVARGEHAGKRGKMAGLYPMEALRYLG